MKSDQKLNKYTFGSQNFPTLALARRWWSEWLKSNLGRSFPRGGEYWPELTTLLKRHPCHSEAVPVSFAVKCNQFGGAELRYYTADGRYHIFSTATAVTGRGKSLESQLVSAMRDAVYKQVAAAKLRSLDTLCGWCGLQLQDTVTHVDHVYPFNDLAKEFITGWAGVIPDEVVQSAVKGGVPAFHPKDALFSTAWQKFHLDRAQLRVIHAGCNLQRGKKHNPSK
jgi:hypothetical protein